MTPDCRALCQSCRLTGQFTGWPCQAFDVLVRLEGLPSAEARKALGKDRERLVRRSMIAMLNDFGDGGPRCADFSA